jgi:hypothetical protein
MRSVGALRREIASLSGVLCHVARFGVIGATVVVSGCAANKAPSYAGAYQPALRPVTERQWKVEIEDDGKPAQLPPVRRMRPEEDDPSQPWSPNYGKGLGSMPSGPVQSQPRPSLPKPIETAYRSGPAPKAMADADAETLIARAVNVHEMRRP